MQISQYSKKKREKKEEQHYDRGMDSYSQSLPDKKLPDAAYKTTIQMVIKQNWINARELYSGNAVIWFFH